MLPPSTPATFRTSSSRSLLPDDLRSPAFRSSFRSNSARINLSFSGVAHDCAIGATAGCAALCCCCPFSFVSLFGLAFVKLPRLVFRKVSRLRGKEGKGPSPSPSAFSDDEIEFVPAVVALDGRASPVFEAFIIAGTGFGVFAEEEYWNEIFGLHGSQLVSSDKQRDADMPAVI